MSMTYLLGSFVGDTITIRHLSVLIMVCSRTLVGMIMGLHKSIHIYIVKLFIWVQNIEVFFKNVCQKKYRPLKKFFIYMDHLHRGDSFFFYKSNSKKIIKIFVKKSTDHKKNFLFIWIIFLEEIVFFQK